MSIFLICGKCDLPAHFHTDHYRNEFEFKCDRDESSISANGRETYVDGRGTYVKRNVKHINDLFTRMEMPDLVLNEGYISHSSVKQHSYADYYLNDATGSIFFNEDFSGPEAWSGSDLAQHRIADDYDVWGLGADDAANPNVNPDLIEFNKVESWTDGTHTVTPSYQTWACTSLLGETEGEYVLKSERVANRIARSKEYLGTVSTESVERTRNVFLEGQDGFASVELLNLDLTEKYQKRLLNVFADKNGRVRIGSIVIEDNADGTKTARCVRDDCGLKATSPSSPTRREMEDFIWAIVAHGNNHAAKWFTERPSFHKVHRLNCDHSKCNDVSSPNGMTHYCAYILPEVTEESDVLVEHYRNCKTPGCTCTELLMEAS